MTSASKRRRRWRRAGSCPRQSLGTEHAGLRLEDGTAAGLLQAGQQLVGGGANRRGPQALVKAGRGQAGQDGHDGEAEYTAR